MSFSLDACERICCVVSLNIYARKHATKVQKRIQTRQLSEEDTEIFNPFLPTVHHVWPALATCVQANIYHPAVLLPCLKVDGSNDFKIKIMSIFMQINLKFQLLVKWWFYCNFAHMLYPLYPCILL